MPPTNIEAHFLGPKGENVKFFKELLVDALDRHVAWRASFGSQDAIFVTDDDQRLADFAVTQSEIKKVLEQVFERLKLSQPFFSPRYIGHMNWDVLTSAAVAYFQTALFNPNNVAKMGSTATSGLEIEVGEDFCNLMGYHPNRGWAHLTAGGTTANMEALWMARNLKYLPVAIRETAIKMKAATAIKVMVKGKLVSLSACKPRDLLTGVLPDDAVRLLERAQKHFKGEHRKQFDDLLAGATLQQRGIRDLDLGVIFVPQTKHYSWKKIVDLLGLGRDSLRIVPVDSRFRMDASLLRTMVLAETRPILAVMAVVGSTEESMVDPVDKVIAVRKEAIKAGKAFYIHVDAAYGGYATALFRGRDGTFLSLDSLREKLKEYKIIDPTIVGRHVTTWPSGEVYEAFKAIAKADSVTLDPHKLGYVQYPAGGIAFKNRGTRESIACFAPYVFRKPEPGKPDDLIGAYILEGSKPGAAAAAVWTAHRTLPLDITGYGRLIGEGIDGAHALHYGLLHHSQEPPLMCEGRMVLVRPVTLPDLNILLYAFNFVGNTDLSEMNRLNGRVEAECFGGLPPDGASMLEKTFIITSTDLSAEEYGDSPKAFLQGMGIELGGWGPKSAVRVLRSTVMSPYLTTDYVDKNYVEAFLETIREKLGRLARE